MIESEMSSPTWIQWLIGVIVTVASAAAGLASSMVWNLSNRIDAMHSENQVAIRSVEEKFDRSIEEMHQEKYSDHKAIWEEFRRMNERWFDRMSTEIRESEKRTILQIGQMLSRRPLPPYDG